jgi:hypothetical protein
VGQQEPVVPRLIDSTCQRRKEAHGAQRCDRIAAHGCADERIHGRGARGGEHFRRLANVVGRDPGDLGNLFGGIGGDTRFQFIESNGPIGNEFLVVPAIGDDNMDHPERQRAIRSGAHAQPQVGFFGEPDRTRIDDDGAGTLLARVLDALVFRRVGFG